MLRRVLVLCALGALLPVAALAAEPLQAGWGPRVGFSVNPDQIVFGGQAIIGEVAQNVTFDPNLELGFGDHATVIAANFDLHYHFEIANSNWRPYAGAGVGVNFISVDLGPGFDNASDTEVGGNIIVGAGTPTRGGNRFFGEIKFGLGDVPDLKMMVGWNFKMH
jgi:hypothetical protein